LKSAFALLRQEVRLLRKNEGCRYENIPAALYFKNQKLMIMSRY